MLKLKWCADLKAESDFSAMNIPYSMRTIKFSQIDLAESSINGARIGEPLVADLIKDYAVGMYNGDTFPSPVVFKTGSGFVLTSGNQRCHAVKSLIDSGEVAKNPDIYVYELETTERFLLEAIARAANVSHGSRTTPQERMAHAVYMVNAHDMKVSDAVMLYMVSSNGLNHQLRGAKVRMELSDRGVDVSHVPNGVLEPLKKLEGDTGAFTKVGSLVSQHKPTRDATIKLVARASKPKSESGRRTVIRKIERELADKSRAYTNKRKTKKLSPKALTYVRRDKLVGCLEKLADFLEHENGGDRFTAWDELQITTDTDMRKVIKLWEKINFRMRVIANK